MAAAALEPGCCVPALYRIRRCVSAWNIASVKLALCSPHCLYLAFTTRCWKASATYVWLRYDQVGGCVCRTAVSVAVPASRRPSPVAALGIDGRYAAGRASGADYAALPVAPTNSGAHALLSVSHLLIYSVPSCDCIYSILEQALQPGASRGWLSTCTCTRQHWLF